MSMVGGKALIVGASGQVGTAMLGLLGAENAIASSRNARPGWMRLDLADLAEVSQAADLLDDVMLNAIYCVGGMTYVDGCEAQPEMAHRTNARGPGVLAGYAKERGVPFVYFSTEYVFDGSEAAPGPYKEDDAPAPLNVYGGSKLAGERMVMAAHNGALVLRTTVVYGPDPRQKNYMYSLMRSLGEGKTMLVAEDQISTPTYNRDLMQATVGLVAAQASGIFHVCGPEVMGRLEFARKVAVTLGLDASLLQGVTTAALGQPAKRPLSAGLASQRLSERYPHLRMRTLAESLEDCGDVLSRFLEDERIARERAKTQ